MEKVVNLFQSSNEKKEVKQSVSPNNDAVNEQPMMNNVEINNTQQITDEEARARISQMLGVDDASIQESVKQQVAQSISGAYQILVSESIIDIIVNSGLAKRMDIEIAVAIRTIDFLTEQKNSIVADIENKKKENVHLDPMRKFQIDFAVAIVNEIDRRIAEINMNITNRIAQEKTLFDAQEILDIKPHIVNEKYVGTIVTIKHGPY